MTLAQMKEGAKIGALLCACLLMGAIAAQVMIQPGHLATAAGSALQPVLDETTGTLKDTHESVVQIKGILTNIHAQIEANDDNMRANAEAGTVLIHDMTQMVRDLNVQFFGGEVNCVDKGRRTPANNIIYDCEKTPGLFPQANTLMAEVNKGVPEIITGTTKLLGTTNDSVKPLKDVLERLAELEVTLNDQVKEGGPKLRATVDEMKQLLVKTEQMLADENLKKIIANVEKTTYHTGEVMETTDIALRDLRKKIGRVKFVLNTILNHVKAVIALH